MADAPLPPPAQNCGMCGVPPTYTVEQVQAIIAAVRASREPSPPVAAPHGDLVAVPRATLISWRQWAAQSMSHAIEHEIAEMCAQPQPQPAQPLTGAPGRDTLVLVPLKFVQGFSDLAHNYQLEAVPPDYYHGVEGDAFRAAYKRCGADLKRLRDILTAPSTPTPAPQEPAREKTVFWPNSYAAGHDD